MEKGVSMEKISCYLVVQDEERRLAKTLAAASQVADEIVVVDSGSTDKTEEISRRYTDKFIYHKFYTIGHQVKYAEEQCRYDWLLRLDGDEVLSDGLIEEIKTIKNNPDCDGYFLRIGDVLPGKKKPIKLVKHYKLIRFYNKKCFSMSGGDGHDDVVALSPAPKTRILQSFVNHYSILSLSQLIAKQNIETDRLAERALRKQKNYSPCRMLGCCSLNFLKYYIIYRYFLYGWWGFILSANNGYMRFLKFAKYYELENS